MQCCQPYDCFKGSVCGIAGRRATSRLRKAKMPRKAGTTAAQPKQAPVPSLPPATPPQPLPPTLPPPLLPTATDLAYPLLQVIHTKKNIKKWIPLKIALYSNLNRIKNGLGYILYLSFCTVRVDTASPIPSARGGAAPSAAPAPSVTLKAPLPAAVQQLPDNLQQLLLGRPATPAAPRVVQRTRKIVLYVIAADSQGGVKIPKVAFPTLCDPRNCHLNVVHCSQIAARRRALFIAQFTQR